MEIQHNLILIDSSKIRKKAVRDLKTTLKKMDSAKQDIQVYVEESKPAFRSWYESAMNELLEKIRNLEKKYQTKEWEVREVFAYAEFHQISPAHAYALIQERKNTPVEEREFDPFYDEEELGYWETEEEEEKSQEYWDEKEEERKKFHEDFEREYGNKENESTEESSPKKPNSGEELTIIFRKIARFLHPDKNPNLNEEDKENWVSALKLYAEKNLGGLRDILTWIHIKNENTDSEVTISEIQALTKKFKYDLKKVQKELRTYKKQPDWNFKKKSKSEKKRIQKEFQEELQSEFIRIHYEMEQLDRVLYSWKQFSKNTLSSQNSFF